MSLNKLLRMLLVTLGTVYALQASSQCSDCNISVTDNSVASYTVSSGQKLCVVGNFTYTGSLTLNGGTICNNGTVKKVIFKSGTFNNAITGKISASSKADLTFPLNGKVILNNTTGSQFILSDSLNLSGTSGDSIIINIHKGSSLNCNSLTLKSANARFNIGQAATTTSSSAFITSFNVNGNVSLNSHVNIQVKELSSLNVTGNLAFTNTGIKTLNNYGTINTTGTLSVSGDGNNTSTVTINNYGEFSVFGPVTTTLVSAVVRIYNLAGLSSAVMYTEKSINLGGSNVQFVNEDVLQVENDINTYAGSFINNSYVEASSMKMNFGAVTNNSNTILSGDMQLNGVDAIFNNNGHMIVSQNFINSGTVNMGNKSVIVTKNFENKATAGVINGTTNPSISNYPRIFINEISQNAGYLNNNMLLVDFTKTDGKGIDVTEGNSNVGSGVLFIYECTYDLEVGFIYAGGASSKRPRTTFCPGENLTLILNSYVPILSGPFWSYGISAASIPFASGMSVPIYTLISGGIVTASGTYNNGVTTCNFSVDFNVSMGTGFIATSSPTYFGIGNTVALNSTITAGSAPFQYTWTPNYFFVSPSSPNDQTPVVAPQVSLVYTVSMVDGYGCKASNTLEVIAEPFALPDKELNGEYYSLVNNQLFFRHEGQYDYSSLNYYVYNSIHSVVASHSTNNLVNTLSIAPGDNRLTLNASTLSAGFYVLELINEKKEKTFLRFKK